MNRIPLPPSLEKGIYKKIGDTHEITIIGGNGAGKSRFMEEMEAMCGKRAYRLDAISAFYAQGEESTEEGSIDSLYREAVRQQSYMRTDAVSQLDKITYMLFADELESLFELKEKGLYGKSGKIGKPRPTRLDIIKRHWEHLFPGNKITRTRGHLMFTTTSGDDMITTRKLSRGEKAALYYLGGVSYAMHGAVIFIDSPSLFIHPSISASLWDTLEAMRPDCTFVYNSVDEDFISSRTNGVCIWVRRYDSEQHAWDYDIIEASSRSEELILELAGTRREVLFIEGDARNSIDAKLYGLVFPEMTMRPLGSCNKVIETTRSFNDLQAMHHLRSHGIVDRDRRSDNEVEYLRKKEIMVPDVAEIENIFLLPDVIKIMARRRGRDAAKVMRRVEKEVMRMFKHHSEEQALQHVRHKVKRDVECKIDARFSCITALETHLRQLIYRLEPRKHYNRLREEFATMGVNHDYRGVLRVFNHKPMLSNCGVHQQLGFHSNEAYIAGVLEALRSDDKDARQLRHTIRQCLHAPEEENRD